MSETDIVNDIRQAMYVEFPQVRLFRNNNGRLRDATGGYVTYGLGPGTSDLVGFEAVIITPQMVGHTIAQFVAVEVKTPSAAPRGRREREHWDRQHNFLAMVRAHGGRSGFARTLAQARLILNQT